MQTHLDKAMRVATLRKVPFLARLGESELQALAEASRAKHYAKGEIIFLEGDTCHGLLVIHSGAVKVFKTSSTGRELVLTIERAGNSVAELPVLDEGPYPASAQAQEDSMLLLVPRQEFYQLCRRHPDIALSMVRSLAGRFRRLVRLIEALAFLEVGQRLARFLLEKANQEGYAVADGIVLSLDLTHQELAAQIGTVRELISRTLTRFHEQGIISIKGRIITIRDLEQLKQEAEVD
jgi:CRP/FNR family transcriptional regulator